MKYASTALLLSVAIATFHTGFALRRQSAISLNPAAIPSEYELLVDEEGNLYSASKTITVASSNVRDVLTAQQARAEGLRTSSALGNTLLALRGGDLSVDTEGNFYFNKAASIPMASQPKVPDTVVVVSAAAPHTSNIRGGSDKLDMFGGLCVDHDGNLCSVQTAASTALGLRGGGLQVDNEGVLFFQKEEQLLQDQALPAPLLSFRRGRSSHEDSVVFAKNSNPKKDATKPKSVEDKRGLYSKENPNAFIFYNNPLIES